MQALVIDDSRAMRLVLARMLTSLGFEVDQAANGQLGLERLAAGPVPDVILVDWHMPEMEGIEFVEHARSAEYAYPGRIIMVTTETEAGQVARALSLGADEYLMKPFTEDAVADKLALLGLDP